jgi:hypothetical protein
VAHDRGHARLGRGVRQAHGLADVDGPRDGGDDGAAARGQQVRDGVAGGQQQAGHAHVDRPLPHGDGQRQQVVLGVDADRGRGEVHGVVVHAVEGAELGHGPVHERPGLRLVGGVEPVRDGDAAVRADRLDRAPRRRLVEVADHHARTLPGQPAAGRAADRRSVAGAVAGPRPAGGHHDHLALESPHAPSPRRPPP